MQSLLKYDCKLKKVRVCSNWNSQDKLASKIMAHHNFLKCTHQIILIQMIRMPMSR